MIPGKHYANAATVTFLVVPSSSLLLLPSPTVMSLFYNSVITADMVLASCLTATIIIFTKVCQRIQCYKKTI